MWFAHSFCPDWTMEHLIKIIFLAANTGGQERSCIPIAPRIALKVSLWKIEYYKVMLYIYKCLAGVGPDCFAFSFDIALYTSPGGGVLSPKSYVNVPAGPRKSDYLYTNFLPNFPPISIPFSKEKHPIWIILGAFYNNLPKIHPIYVIWAPSSLMKTPRSLYQISWKSDPKGRHIYVYHVNVRTPPRYTSPHNNWRYRRPWP